MVFKHLGTIKRKCVEMDKELEAKIERLLKAQNRAPSDEQTRRVLQYLIKREEASARGPQLGDSWEDTPYSTSAGISLHLKMEEGEVRSILFGLELASMVGHQK